MLTYILAGITLVVLAIIGYVVRIRAATRSLARNLVPGIQAMRRLASQEIRYYRPLRADESIPADAAYLFDQAQRELTAQGLVVLGDLMEQAPQGAPAPTRWFIDKTQTVCGWFGVLRNKAKGSINPVMMFFSEGRDAFFITGRGTTGTATAQPAINHRVWLEWDVGLGETLRRHQAQIAEQRAVATQQAATLDAGPALVGRLRERTARWRGAQPPDALLEQDVRGLVGDHWDIIGPTVVRLLSADAGQA